MLINENLQGIYVIPSKENPFCKFSFLYFYIYINAVLLAVWFGVIFVRCGPYEDGIFRFTIELPENFPEGGHPVSIVYTL